MTFDPENSFEESLVKAASDPAHRPQFYQDLCEADLFIIQHGVELPSNHERTTLSEGTSIQIQSIEYNEKPYIPVFSSISRLQVFISGEEAYLGINALELMKLTQGAEFLLNPGSDYGKEFTRNEIESILDGSIWQADERYTATEDTQVMLGQPKNYPHELVDALSRFFKTKKEVKRAWVAHFFNPQDGQPPHTLIAVDAPDGFQRVLAETSVVVRNVNIPDPPVDFIAITATGGLEDYFIDGEKPFYVRKLFGIF